MATRRSPLPIDHLAIHDAHVAGRKVVYLDTSAWGDVSAAEHAELRRRLEAGVRAGLLALPLSYAALAELWHHPAQPHRERIARCMDDLSGGVCFRFVAHVGEQEADHAWPWLVGDAPRPPGREQLFTWAAMCLGDGLLSFPEEWTAAGVEVFSRLVAERPELRSVTWLAEHLTVEAMRNQWKEHARLIEQEQRGRAAALRNSSMFRNRAGKTDFARVIEEERTYLLRKFLLPALRDAMLRSGSPLQQLLRVQAQVARGGDGGPERLAEVFSLVPSFEMRAQVFAARVMNPERRDRAQDFWDHQHAAVAPAYSDAFVAGDRGLVDLLSRRCSLPAERGCAVVRGLAGLEALLEEWQVC